MTRSKCSDKRSTAALARWTLATALSISFTWCIDYYWARWETTVVPLQQRPTVFGEGLVIQWNGLGYYAWLRSLLVDTDWSFDNEFDEHNPLHDYVPPRTYRTPLGRRANQWSVGPACLWATSVVPGHLCLRIGQCFGLPWAANGYSLPYQVLVGITSLAVSAVGLGFVYASCRTYAGTERAALVATWMMLGTSVFHYTAIEISYAHGPGFAALAIMVWYWVGTYDQPRLRRWFLVGVLLGLAALMRWQLSSYAVLPVGEAISSVWREVRKKGHGVLRQPLARLVAAGAGTCCAFAPQLIAWRSVYGTWLVSPILGVHDHWLTPSLLQILFSTDRGFFYWTPMTVLIVAGALSALLLRPGCEVSRSDQCQAPRAREIPAMLLAAFVVQLYVLGAMWGKGPFMKDIGLFEGIYLARSFGCRDLTESLVVLAPGCALAAERLPFWGFRLFVGVASVLVIWNLLLVAAYCDKLLPQAGGAGIGTLAQTICQMVSNEPSVFVHAALGTSVIAALGFAGGRGAGWAFSENAP